MDSAGFEGMTDEQLRVYARDAGVRDVDSLGRADLIAAVTGLDDAMTRSEERLVPSTDVVEIGRARLRKYVVTEEVQITVQVRREELRLEREAVPAADQQLVPDPDVFGPDDVFGGPDGGVVFEITLHEERPVVATEIVPVERVRLSKLVRTDTEIISGPVRKERIEAEFPDGHATTLG